MSAFVCSDKTISVIAKGFESYGVDLVADGYTPPPVSVLYNASRIINSVGQALLNYNYDSVNYRYDENTTPREFVYDDTIEFDEGRLLGCINCYIYQTCEIPDFFQSKLYNSLLSLKTRMLERFINRANLEIDSYC